MPKKQPTKARDENWRRKKIKKIKRRRRRERVSNTINQSSADCTAHMNTTIKKKSLSFFFLRHKLFCCRPCEEQLSLGYVFCCDVICVMDLFLSSVCLLSNYNAVEAALRFFLHFLINEPLVVSWTALWGVIKYTDLTLQSLKELVFSKEVTSNK